LVGILAVLSVVRPTKPPQTASHIHIICMQVF